MNWHDYADFAISVRMLFFFPAMAIGVFSPVFRRSRITLLASSACLLIAMMAYSYVTSTPETLGLGGSTSNRQEALVIIACEFAVLAFSLLSVRRSRVFFWLGWSGHALLTIFCAVVAIWLEFFWHW